ncbi:hypothetical protein Bpfe_016517 [Biomphalaria pfeifferi]|uniref:Uncharacterized protein n=1 Tax=Biomphalaria pfeifferi TaxID=112525 RepID=A0AAD8BG79_BIOPF|nr:hypothetical protein Bpfe_016517 [Biomphalaria pfeifferi]
MVRKTSRLRTSNGEKTDEAHDDQRREDIRGLGRPMVRRPMRLMTTNGQKSVKAQSIVWILLSRNTLFPDGSTQYEKKDIPI